MEGRSIPFTWLTYRRVDPQTRSRRAIARCGFRGGTNGAARRPFHESFRGASIALKGDAGLALQTIVIAKLLPAGESDSLRGDRRGEGAGVYDEVIRGGRERIGWLASRNWGIRLARGD